MVKIIHTADWHLDPVKTNFLNRDEERRKDFLKNFDKIINFSLEEKPDLILISGDIFDSINPRNPVRVHVIRQLKKLYEKKIKIYAIGGNHDMPRSIENAYSPISILDTIEYLDFIKSGEEFVSKRELNINNLKINIFGESYAIFNPGGKDPLDKIKFPAIEGDLNLFLVHGSIGLFKYSYLGDYIMKEINIPEEIDYVAAGHLHEHLEKSRNNPNLGTITHFVYPGSIEYLGFNENLDNPKGFMFLEFEKKELVNKEFIKLETRPIKKLTIPISKNDINIYEKILAELDTLKNPKLILKIILEGKIKTEQISSLRSSKIIDFGDSNLFKLFLDAYSKLSFEKSELILPDKARSTPKEIFMHVVNRLIKKEENEELRNILKAAQRISLEKLKKWGID